MVGRNLPQHITVSHVRLQSFHSRSRNQRHVSFPQRQNIFGSMMASVGLRTAMRGPSAAIVGPKQHLLTGLGDLFYISFVVTSIVTPLVGHLAES